MLFSTYRMDRYSETQQLTAANMKACWVHVVLPRSVLYAHAALIWTDTQSAFDVDSLRGVVKLKLC